MNELSAMRATFLIMALFLLQPLVIGGWLAIIPLVQEDLGLSKAELALALMGTPIALIPCLQVAGRVVARFGPRRIFIAVFPLQSVAGLLPLVAWSGPSLFVALFLLGAAIAFLEVGINVYAGRLEKRSDLAIMNRCHGFWALGLACGSAAVTFLVANPLHGLAMLALISTLAGVAGAKAMPVLGDGDVVASPPRRRMADVPVALVPVAAFMFFATLAEGSLADWAAVYLAERTGSVETRAGIAVTIFSAFMAGGRFAGDWLKLRLGAVRLARVTTGSAILGLLLLVLPLPLALALPGFALAGFGISTAYPLGVSAVAALDDRYEASNIAIMATVALGGFLVGPPLIGFLAEAFSLPVALGALVPGLVLALYLTRWLGIGSSGQAERKSGPSFASR